MSTTGAPPSPSLPPPATDSPVMLNGTKKFIGAVEDEWQLYSDRASDYVIGPSIGFGASSIVYSATYYPSSSNTASNGKDNKQEGIPCALKVLDLDSLPQRTLHLLQRETRLMSLSKHPNVLRVRGSWMDGHKLYIALRLMNKGSAADVMRFGWPGGMEEDVCRCILRQALQGLNYLHINGFIHRDVKAANLLIDDDGTVLLGDLGVAADLTEDSAHLHTSSRAQRVSATVALSSAAISPINPRKPPDDNLNPSRPRIGKRKSFVGTPCWMAPELIQGRQYDASADIWSFGITALELTQGRPPRSRESPQKVLLKTIQEDPPTLDRDGGTYKYSRAFKEVIDSCLVKDPAQRPTAAELLQTPFFKGAKQKSYLINTILKGLPPLVQRQERRVVANSIRSANSIDSWDFSTTVNSPLSPTTSVFRRTVLQSWATTAEAEEALSEGREDLQLDEEEPIGRSLKAVSWSASANTVTTAPIPIQPSHAIEPSYETEVPLSSSPSSASESSALEDSSNADASSAPSSYCEPSELDQRLNLINLKDEPEKENLESIPEHGSSSQPLPAPEPTPDPALAPSPSPRPVQAFLAQDPAASTSGTPLYRTISAAVLGSSSKNQREFPPLSSSLPASATSSPGLWKKFKANVKRPVSRDGKMGAMIESASRGFLRSSTSMKSLRPSTSHSAKS